MALGWQGRLLSPRPNVGLRSLQEVGGAAQLDSSLPLPRWSKPDPAGCAVSTLTTSLVQCGKKSQSGTFAVRICTKSWGKCGVTEGS